MVRNYKRKTEDRWTKEDLLEALLLIKDGKSSIANASRKYGMSRITLYRRYKKFVAEGSKNDVHQFSECGANPILTKVEEDVLEKTIRDLRKQGFTVTSSDIKRMCFEYCETNGNLNQFNQENRIASDDWYYGFLSRHPDVRMPKPGETNSTSSASSIEFSAASITSPDQSPKAKKLKLTPPPKKIMKHDRTPPRSPGHVQRAGPSKVTSAKQEKQTMEAVAAATSAAAVKGRKQKQDEVDSEDMEEDDEAEAGMNLGYDDLEAVIQTEEAEEDDEEEDEESEEDDDEEEQEGEEEEGEEEESEEEEGEEEEGEEEEGEEEVGEEEEGEEEEGEEDEGEEEEGEEEEGEEEEGEQEEGEEEDDDDYEDDEDDDVFIVFPIIYEEFIF